tara:strand:- start:2346 stop:2519 length:174 start_codon:yes stop_codon:yes gene_type:complete
MDTELLKKKISKLEEKISGNDDEYSDYYNKYGTSQRQDMLEEVDRLKILRRDTKCKT